MDGGYESDYPEPSPSTFSPYPALSRNASGPYPLQHGTSSAAASQQGHAPVTSSQQEPLLAEAMRTYAEQAQQWWSRQSTFGFGANAESQRSDGNSATNEANVAPGFTGPPMANAFFGPSANLDSYLGAGRQHTAAGGEDMSMDGSDAEDSVIQYEPSSIRGRGGRGSRGRRGSGRQRESRGWRSALKRLEERNPALREPKPEKQARGRGRGKPRGRPRGGRKAVDPGSEFKDSQAKATEAFLMQDYEGAMLHVLQAIRANPEVFQAHSLYSEILMCLGRDNDAVAALMVGASSQKDAGPWLTAGRRTLELAEGTRPEAVLNQALMCFTAARDCDVNNYEARVGMVECFIELGNSGAARSQSKNMLRMRPDDVINVRQYAELCADTGDPVEFLKAKTAYDEAFSLYADKESFGDPAEQWSHLNVYLELVDRVGVTAESVAQLRRLARWFLGRKEETFWDRYTDDDREFDSGNERRAYVGEFQQGRASRDRAQYGDGLPLEIRVKLGIFRIKMGMSFHDEGRQHLDHLLQLSDQIENYYDIFFVVADTLKNSCLYKDALQFYDPVERLPEVINEEFLMGAAECYRHDGQYEEAEAHYLEIIENNDEDIQARIALAKMYIYTEENDKAKPLLKQVISLGHKDLLRKANLPLSDVQKEMKKAQRTAQRTAEREAELEALWENDPQFDHMSLPAFVPAGEGTFQEFSINAPSTETAQGPEEPRRRTSVQRPDTGVNATFEEQVHEPKTKRPKGPKAPKQPKPPKPPKEPRSRAKFYRPNLSAKKQERIRLLEEQEPGVRREYGFVNELWPALEEGDDDDAIDEWVEHAEKLTATFRGMDVFYTDRLYREFTGYAGKKIDDLVGRRKEHGEAQAMLNRLTEGSEDRGTLLEAVSARDTVPKHFHDISFAEWHRIFVDLALMYARNADQDKCYDILNNALQRGNVFIHDPVLHNITFATCLYCAITFNDSAYVTDIARRYIGLGDYRAGMPYQLLAAANRLCYNGNWFTAGPTQKFMLRQVKTYDHISMPPEIREKVNWGAQLDGLQKRLEKYGHGSTPLDSSVLTIYGHMVAEANFSHSSLPYYFRAFALQPDNPGISLSIAAVMVQSAMKRQTENRQYGIHQALSFLYKYYDLWTASGKAGHVQEAEYNVARTWHLLGLTHLAMPAYERVLALSRQVQTEHDKEDEYDAEDFAQEAAFALQQLYALAGNDEAARAVSKEWLVL